MLRETEREAKTFPEVSNDKFTYSLLRPAAGTGTGKMYVKKTDRSSITAFLGQKNQRLKRIPRRQVDHRRQESTWQGINMERTFLMVKPDGVQRGLIGEIVTRFERRGFKMVASRFERLPDARVMEHYAEHVQKPFFPGLKAYITSAPAFSWYGKGKTL